MTIIADIGSRVTNRLVASLYAGWGVLAQDIPEGSFLENDVSLPTDNDIEVCYYLTTQLTDGTATYEDELTLYENGAFVFDGSGLADGTYWFDYQLTEVGEDNGSPVRVYLYLGETGSTIVPADGVATVSATGRALFAATATAASGVASVSAIGGGRFSGSLTPAAGSAVVSAASAAQSASTATAAGGTATVSVVGSTLSAGSSSAVPATGVATVSASARSESASNVTPAAGSATVSATTGGVTPTQDNVMSVRGAGLQIAIDFGSAAITSSGQFVVVI